MNYLAHIFISGGVGRRQFGNFIGDAVKGSSYKDYPKGISDGILLHRAIDHFTDEHPMVKSIVRSLKPHFGRYSALLLDIYFDYLLASRFSHFSKTPLKRYTRRFYLVVIQNYRFLPPRMKRFIWHFIGTDRLGRYARLEGIRESLDIMVRYRGLGIDTDRAIEYLSDNEELLFDRFRLFFRELQSFCDEYIDSNLARA